MAAAYITQQDLLVYIQQKGLDQVVTIDTYKYNQIIKIAEDQAKSFLRNKFDIDVEFIGIQTYVATSLYYANDLVLYNGTLYYALLPAGVGTFAFEQFYNIGDNVYYQGTIYQAIQKSVIPSQDSKINTGIMFKYSELGYINYAPYGDPNSYQQWQVNTTLNNLFVFGKQPSYVIPAGSIANAAYFTIGDNRDSVIVKCVTLIACYELMRAISPMNVPKQYLEGYDWSISTLQAINKGDITTTIPLLSPVQPQIRWGSSVKLANKW